MRVARLLWLFALILGTVLVGQASADVVASADDVTAPVHEDGLARELERWF